MINMSSTAKSRGILLGTLIGGAVGVVSAFLLAPKSGEKLRKDIATKYRFINDKMQKMVATVGETTQEAASSVGQKAHDIEDIIVDKTSEVKDNVVNAWQDSKEEVKREADNQRQPFSNYK
jgi:gas vesicle protein